MQSCPEAFWLNISLSTAAPQASRAGPSKRRVAKQAGTTTMPDVGPLTAAARKPGPAIKSAAVPTAGRTTALQVKQSPTDLMPPAKPPPLTPLAGASPHPPPPVDSPKGTPPKPVAAVVPTASLAPAAQAKQSPVDPPLACPPPAALEPKAAPAEPNAAVAEPKAAPAQQNAAPARQAPPQRPPKASATAVAPAKTPQPIQDPKLIEQVHQVAAEAMKEFSTNTTDDATYIRIDPRYILPDPINRDATMLDDGAVMGLLLQILIHTWQLHKNLVGIVADVLPARLGDIKTSYANLVGTNPRLPPAGNNGDPVLYTAFHTNTFVTICRCFIYRTFATKEVAAMGVCDDEGRLSLKKLQAVQPNFHDYIVGGVRMVRLRKDVTAFPRLVHAIVVSANLDGAQGESESQLFTRARAAVWPADGTDVDPNKVKGLLTAQFPHQDYLINGALAFVKAFGNQGAPFIDDALTYKAEFLAGIKARTDPDVLLALSRLPPHQDIAAAAMAMLKDLIVEIIINNNQIVI